MRTSTEALVKALLRNPLSIKSRSQAQQLHAQVLKFQASSLCNLSLLLSIYSHINLLHDSLRLFNTIHFPPALAWKSVIRCYTSHGLPHQSLGSFIGMLASGLYPDHNVFPSVLKSCALLMDLNLGESLHGYIIRVGLDFDLYTGNALMNMYSKLRFLEESGRQRLGAGEVFDEMTERTRSVRTVSVLVGNEGRKVVDCAGPFASPAFSASSRLLQFASEHAAYSTLRDEFITSLLVDPASDRFNINSQLEHLQAKYVGTGHADLNRFEWAVNIQRDSYASYVGHYPILAYFAVAENESIGRERYNFMQKMLLPCGLPPEREDD
ncbi:hypothetical protein Csa_003800 [Cucumis sativus]|nr:hypothetical protein Csa_003800 [Cucumis sativus]